MAIFKLKSKGVFELRTSTVAFSLLICLDATKFVLLRACLHGFGGTKVGEVTRLGGVTPLSI